MTHVKHEYYAEIEMAVNDEKGSERIVLYLSAGTKADLRKAAAASGLGERGMSEEVRQRLEASFALEKYTIENRYLGAAVTNIAESVTEYFGPWSQHLFAHEVLLSAIGTLLETMKPSGEAEPKFNPKSIADVLFDPKDGPENIGRSLAGIALATTPNIRPMRKS
jgi:hypothetical protein